MSLGTIAVATILIGIVGTTAYRLIKGRRSGASPHCGGCCGGGSNCVGCAQVHVPERHHDADKGLDQKKAPEPASW